MKASILVFILMLVSPFSASSEDRAPFPAFSFPPAEGHRDFSQLWKSFGEWGKIEYVRGFMEGELNGELIALTLLKPKCDVQAIKQYESDVTPFSGITIVLLKDTITGLYNDRANSFVSLPDILYIALDKIRGMPIEERLAEARKRALKLHD